MRRFLALLALQGWLGGVASAAGFGNGADWYSRNGDELAEQFGRQVEQCVQTQVPQWSLSADTDLADALDRVPAPSPCFAELKAIVLSAPEAAYRVDPPDQYGQGNATTSLLAFLTATENGHRLLAATVNESPNRANRAYAALLLWLVSSDAAPDQIVVEGGSADPDIVALAELYTKVLMGDSDAVALTLAKHFDPPPIGTGVRDLAIAIDRHVLPWVPDVPIPESSGRAGGGWSWTPDSDRALVLQKRYPLYTALTGADVVRVSFVRNEAAKTVLAQTVRSNDERAARMALQTMLLFEPATRARESAMAALGDSRRWVRDAAWMISYEFPSVDFRELLTDEDKTALRESKWSDVRGEAKKWFGRH